MIAEVTFEGLFLFFNGFLTNYTLLHLQKDSISFVESSLLVQWVFTPLLEHLGILVGPPSCSILLNNQRYNDIQSTITETIEVQYSVLGDSQVTLNLLLCLFHTWRHHHFSWSYNHSLITTAATQLYHTGVDKQSVMEQIGHHSLEEIRNYKCSSKQQCETISDILNFKKVWVDYNEVHNSSFFELPQPC